MIINTLTLKRKKEKEKYTYDFHVLRMQFEKKSHIANLMNTLRIESRDNLLSRRKNNSKIIILLFFDSELLNNAWQHSMSYFL